MQIETFSYDEHARTPDPGDFGGQVKLTAAGKPISETKIPLIVAAVERGMELGRPDIIVDVDAATGALSDKIFTDCHRRALA